MSPAEDLAKANGTIAVRLAEDMSSLALLVENSLVSVFAEDGVFTAGQKLADVLDTMLRSAERQRLLDDG